MAPVRKTCQEPKCGLIGDSIKRRDTPLRTARNRKNSHRKSSSFRSRLRLPEGRLQYDQFALDEVGGKTVNALFDVLTEAHPIVVCFDELDGLFRSRNKDSVDADLVSTFLVRLDDLDEARREGRIQVAVIATTNNTNSLDSAVRSRFSTAHRIDRPSTLEREVFLKSLFSTDHQADLTKDE